MGDAKSKLAELTGIPEQKLGDIMKEVKANLVLLGACPRHAFGEHVQLQRRYTCANCGGGVSAEARRWYELGLSHGSGS